MTTATYSLFELLKIQSAILVGVEAMEYLFAPETLS